MAAKEDAVIRVRNLTARYGGATILDDISFDVRKGEIFVILGGSGCGKSTLLRHLVGLQPPHGGEIWIDGMDFAKVSTSEGRGAILRKMGVLFQSGALLGSLTLAENITLVLEEYTSLPREVIETIARMKLSLVGLTGYENHLPSEISGGMKKRAGLARAMALDPMILFCDEPSAGLDPISAASLDELLIRLNRHLGMTMIIVTHELASIFKLAQRVIMLDKRVKRIVAEGDPADLRDHSADPWVRSFFNREPMS